MSMQVCPEHGVEVAEEMRLNRNMETGCEVGLMSHKEFYFIPWIMGKQ